MCFSLRSLGFGNKANERTKGGKWALFWVAFTIRYLGIVSDAGMIWGSDFD